MSLGSGSGGGGTGRSASEVGLSPEGLQAKRDFESISRTTGEEPACVVSEFESGTLGEDIDYLLANTVEVAKIPTSKGNTMYLRRCGRVACTVDCALLTDPENNIIDAVQITASSVCRERR